MMNTVWTSQKQYAVGGLTGKSRQRLDKLKARHDEVVRHEDAHYKTALEHGLQAQRPVLTDWVEGADGQRYATGGHVMISTGTTGNPEIDLKRGQGMVAAAEAPLSVDSELSQADKDIAAKGRAIIAANEPKVQKLEDLKNRIHGSGLKLTPTMVGNLATGMGLDIPQGQLINIFGV